MFSSNVQTLSVLIFLGMLRDENLMTESFLVNFLVSFEYGTFFHCAMIGTPGLGLLKWLSQEI